jgi:hypothetical protein
MDASASYLGGRHRVVGHNLAAFQAIELLFGREGRIVATLHVLQDAGVLRGPGAPERAPKRHRAEQGRLFP